MINHTAYVQQNSGLYQHQHQHPHPNSMVQFRVVNTNTHKKFNFMKMLREKYKDDTISTQEYSDLWNYKYILDTSKEGIVERKLHKFQQLLLKYTPQYVQLQVKYNNRFIPYDSWLDIAHPV